MEQEYVVRVKDVMHKREQQELHALYDRFEAPDVVECFIMPNVKQIKMLTLKAAHADNQELLIGLLSEISRNVNLTADAVEYLKAREQSDYGF